MSDVRFLLGKHYIGYDQKWCDQQRYDTQLWRFSLHT